MQWKVLRALAASSGIACCFWIQICYNLLTFSLHMLYVSSRPSFGGKLYNMVLQNDRTLNQREVIAKEKVGEE